MFSMTKKVKRKKLYCVICGKYRKFEKLSYLLEKKKSVLFIICSKCKNDKTVLLAKSKLNSIGVLISNALIDSVISHEELVLINDVVKEYNEMKEEIKNLNS